MNVLGPDGSFQVLGTNVGVIIFDDISLTLAEALADADVDLLGTPDDDTLDGAGVAGTILGLDGNDTIIAGTTTEIINGGGGIDTADLSNLEDGVTLFLQGTGFVFSGLDLKRVTNFENLIGTDFNDQIFDTNGTNVIEAGDGNDRVIYSGGQDTIRLGKGDDILNFDLSTAVGGLFSGGQGVDEFLYNPRVDSDFRNATIQDFEVFDTGFSSVAHTFLARQFEQFERIEIRGDTGLNIFMDGRDEFALSGSTLVLLDGNPEEGAADELDVRVFADRFDTFDGTMQLIEGSARAETVVIDGLRADFTVTVVNEGETHVTDVDGNTYLLFDIETVEFTDDAVEIGDANTAPVVTPFEPNLIASLGDIITLDLTQGVTDAEGDTLSFEILSLGLSGGFEGSGQVDPADFSISSEGLLTLDLSALPNFNQVGRSDFFFKYTVSDGSTEVHSSSSVELIVLGAAIEGSSGSDEIGPGDTLGGVTVDGSDGLDDSIFGRGGNDVIDGGLGHDVIFGGNGWDFLFGGVGDDIIFGGNGNDTLIGADGSDELNGGDGADIFVFGVNTDGSQDTITDFAAGQDKIDISALVGDVDHVDLLVSGDSKSSPFSSVLVGSSATRGNAASSRLQIEVFEFGNDSNPEVELNFSLQGPIVGPTPEFSDFAITLFGSAAADLSLDDFIF